MTTLATINPFYTPQTGPVFLPRPAVRPSITYAKLPAAPNWGCGELIHRNDEALDSEILSVKER